MEIGELVYWRKAPEPDNPDPLGFGPYKIISLGRVGDTEFDAVIKSVDSGEELAVLASDLHYE